MNIINCRNKMKMIRLIIAVLVFAIAYSVKGQQDFFNLQIINPAYAGSWGTTGFIGSSKFDFWGDKVATTQLLSFQSILKSPKIGIGLNITHNNIGIERNLSTFVNYSYLLTLSKYTSLRLGINGGIMNYRVNLTETNFWDGIQDPAFQSKINEYYPNIGAGLYLFSNRYYFGISLPKFIKNKYDVESKSLFSVGGLIFDFAKNLKFKPSIITQLNSEKKIEYDLSANFLINKKIWIGGFYRSLNSIGTIIEWTGFKNFRIGYLFDYNLDDIRKFNHGTHEVMVSYALDNKFPIYF